MGRKKNWQNKMLQLEKNIDLEIDPINAPENAEKRIPGIFPESSGEIKPFVDKTLFPESQNRLEFRTINGNKLFGISSRLIYAARDEDHKNKGLALVYSSDTRSGNRRFYNQICESENLRKMTTANPVMVYNSKKFRYSDISSLKAIF